MGNIKLDEIELKIKEGAKKAYRENLYFTRNHTNFQSKIIENLIVINIAQSLLDWVLTNELHIQLEYPIRHFYNGAFPKIKWDKRLLSNPLLFLKRIEHNPIQNKSGRVDLVITKVPNIKVDGIYLKPSLRSIIGIEVKSINNSVNDIKKDFTRMASAIELKDDLSTNNIQACYCIFYRRLDKLNKIYTKDEINKIKDEDYSKWHDIFSKLVTQKVSYNIDREIISENCFEDLNGYYSPEEFEANEIAEQTGLVVCYLVRITRE